jgi:hypothetical protein
MCTLTTDQRKLAWGSSVLGFTREPRSHVGVERAGAGPCGRNRVRHVLVAWPRRCWKKIRNRAHPSTTPKVDLTSGIAMETRTPQSGSWLELLTQWQRRRVNDNRRWEKNPKKLPQDRRSVLPQGNIAEMGGGGIKNPELWYHVRNNEWLYWWMITVPQGITYTWVTWPI